MSNKKIGVFSTLLISIGVFAMHACANENYAEQRADMIADIQATASYTSEYTGKHKLDARVIKAIINVPRHEFVPISMRKFAYQNRPLPIGQGQTISQPYIVALMTELAGVNKDSKVLEVGTGSGYQAAVLAELVKHVYSVEILEGLGNKAQQTLQRLGYKNVTIKIGDGYHGWIEHAPFDAIIVTAAPEKVPQPLLEQLKPGGKLVIPVGSQYTSQSLKLIEKDLSGAVHENDVLAVGFVPLTGDH